MPLIDVKCPDCGHTFEHQRLLADYPHVPPCVACASPATVQFHPPPQARWTIDPVVVFRAADGTYRFPGDAHGLSAAAYVHAGYDRVELRGSQEVRSFEKRMNKVEYDRLSRRAERVEQIRQTMDSQRRSELRHLMASMSRLGRDVARAAMARSDQRSRRAITDIGFHVDVYSNDRSNRDDSRDSAGRRRRD